LTSGVALRFAATRVLVAGAVAAVAEAVADAVAVTAAASDGARASVVLPLPG
jgi:hypothetical protein